MTAAEWTHGTQIIGLIRRHFARQPHGDVTNTIGSCSLMSCGRNSAKSG